MSRLKPVACAPQRNVAFPDICRLANQTPGTARACNAQLTAAALRSPSWSDRPGGNNRE